MTSGRDQLGCQPNRFVSHVNAVLSEPRLLEEPFFFWDLGGHLTRGREKDKQATLSCPQMQPPTGSERSLGAKSIENTGHRRRQRKFLQGAKADLHCDTMVQLCGVGIGGGGGGHHDIGAPYTPSISSVGCATGALGLSAALCRGGGQRALAIGLGCPKLTPHMPATCVERLLGCSAQAPLLYPCFSCC